MRGCMRLPMADGCDGLIGLPGSQNAAPRPSEFDSERGIQRGKLALERDVNQSTTMACSAFASEAAFHDSPLERDIVFAEFRDGLFFTEQRE